MRNLRMKTIAEVCGTSSGRSDSPCAGMSASCWPRSLKGCQYILMARMIAFVFAVSVVASFHRNHFFYFSFGHDGHSFPIRLRSWLVFTSCWTMALQPKKVSQTDDPTRLTETHQSKMIIMFNIITRNSWRICLIRPIYIDDVRFTFNLDLFASAMNAPLASLGNSWRRRRR